MKLFMHSQNLTASSLKFGNGQVLQAIHYMVLITQLDIEYNQATAKCNYYLEAKFNDEVSGPNGTKAA